MAFNISTSRPSSLDFEMRNAMIRKDLEDMGSTKQDNQPPLPKPEPQKQEPVSQLTASTELPMPYHTVKWESRLDKNGYPEIYKLPSGDMGGSYEISGINDRYHPDAFKAISSLPPEQRTRAAAEYIKGYTAPLVSQLPQGMRAFAQDMAFNRGLGGATKYIQQGLNALGQNVAVDGSFGPKTLGAINNVQPQALMRAASDAQLQDELAKAEQDPRRQKFIPGLESRIRNRLAMFGQI